MKITARILFLVAAVVCFTIALLLTLDVVSGGNTDAWRDGGLLALALGFVSP